MFVTWSGPIRRGRQVRYLQLEEPYERERPARRPARRPSPPRR
jgi:hypothetical protein